MNEKRVLVYGAMGATVVLFALLYGSKRKADVDNGFVEPDSFTPFKRITPTYERGGQFEVPDSWLFPQWREDLSPNNKRIANRVCPDKELSSDRNCRLYDAAYSPLGFLKGSSYGRD